ncbi:MAG: DUF6323 family protein [Clostridiales bacterium]|nr:DUF6323 family protein [Clostridiales bacterium]
MIRMDKNWLLELTKSNAPEVILDTNRYTNRFGLTLTREDAELIQESRREVLQEQRRVEFGEGIAPELIKEFCDSDYLDQSNFAETIIQLQEIFYTYKNELGDEVTDEELLRVMRELFESRCGGDLEMLSGTCLSDFSISMRDPQNRREGEESL